MQGGVQRPESVKRVLCSKKAHLSGKEWPEMSYSVPLTTLALSSLSLK